MQSNYNAIDLMKFIMALFVVIVHVEPLMTISPTFTYLFDKVIVRASVPFFFLAAGFFLYRKMNFDSLNLSIIGSYILRIFRVYFVWTILYLPLILYKLPNDLQSVKDAAKFFLREFFMIGSYAQLWFLPALIMAVIFVTCLIKLQIKFKYIFIITGGLYILGLLDQSYYGFFKEFWSDESGKLYKILDYLQAIFGTTRNGFTFGALYVAIGAYIAFNNVKISIKRTFIGSVIFAILFAIEFAILSHFEVIKDANTYIFTVPLTVSIFMLSKELKLPDSPIFLHLRQMSMLFYYSHVLIAEPILLGSQSLNFELNRLLIFAITIILLFLMSELVIRLSSNKKFKFLKLLY